LLTGRVAPGETVTASTEIRVNGTEYSYERRTTAVADGHYSIRVAYPGQYRIRNRTVRVTPEHPAGGGFHGSKEPVAHWAFEENRGTVVFDRRGGNHGRLSGGGWADGINGTAYQSGRSDYATVSDLAIPGDANVTISFWFNASRNSSRENRYPRLISTSPERGFGETAGYQLALNSGHIFASVGDGTQATKLWGPEFEVGTWHRVTLNQTGSRVTLSVDGKRHSSTKIDHDIRIAGVMKIGGADRNQGEFSGRIDEVIFESQAGTPN
jgi:hypothetical protein